MRWWWLVLVGCAGATAPIPPDDPRTVYDAMARHFAQARTGVAHGSIELDGPDGQHHDERYQLQFVRGDRWRLSFGSPGDEIVIWADAEHTYVKLPGTQRLDLGPDHAKAIAGMTKVSGGAATAVLALLLGTADRPTDLVWADPPDAHLARLRGKERGDVVELAIDRDHAQLVAITWWRSDGKITLRGTPVLDDALSPASLAMPELGSGPTWLGIRTEDAPARVSQIVPGAPADKAGVKIGDEVVSIDGKAIADAKAVVDRASELKANTPAPLVVRRKGVEVPLTVTPEPRPDAAKVQATFVGKPAPAISLPPLGGGAPITLVAGQATVLDFWATWCGPCAILSPHLEDLTKKFPALRVIGISDEDAADVAAYLAKHKMTYPLALDPGDRATRDYLVQGLPTVIVIDKVGVVRYATVGVPTFSELDAAVTAAVR